MILFKLTGCKCFHQHLLRCTGPLEIQSQDSHFCYIKYRLSQRFPLSPRIKLQSQSSKWRISNKSCSEPPSTKFNFNPVSYRVQARLPAPRGRLHPIPAPGFRRRLIERPGPRGASAAAAAAALSASWARPLRAPLPRDPTPARGQSRLSRGRFAPADLRAARGHVPADRRVPRPQRNA